MRKRDKVKTQRKILKSAINVFETDGFLKGSTEKIARKARVAHGTVFFYFPTKADLIIEAIYTKMGVLAEKLNEKSRETTDVSKLCMIFLKGVSQNSKFYSRLVKDLPHLPMDVQRHVFSSLSGFSIHFVDVIEKKQKDGNIRTFDPKYAMFMWFGLIQYIYSYPEMLGTEEFTQEEKRELVTFFTKSLAA